MGDSSYRRSNNYNGFRTKKEQERKGGGVDGEKDNDKDKLLSSSS